LERQEELSTIRKPRDAKQARENSQQIIPLESFVKACPNVIKSVLMDRKLKPFQSIWSTCVNKAWKKRKPKKQDTLLECADKLSNQAEEIETKFSNWERNDPDEFSSFRATTDYEHEMAYVRKLRGQALEKREMSQAGSRYAPSWYSRAHCVTNDTRRSSWNETLLRHLQI
jgi:hypothetical protein